MGKRFLAFKSCTTSTSFWTVYPSATAFALNSAFFPNTSRVQGRGNTFSRAVNTSVNVHLNIDVYLSSFEVFSDSRYGKRVGCCQLQHSSHGQNFCDHFSGNPNALP